MNKKQAKRWRDIRTKLTAAICMLLVSSIMMVSTTYAWFTLSTAPEVTGINTAVGANGNLEMALVPEDGNLLSITSPEGSSNWDPSKKNVTWGNLVELGYVPDGSTENYYGLDKIALFPAALNVKTYDGNQPATFGDRMLKTPDYGADGRVGKMLENTFTSTYKKDETGATVAADFPTNNFSGVRAVGVSSGMTPRQLDYRNAISSASSAITGAGTLAKNSMATYGNDLVSIILNHVTGKGSETYTINNVETLKGMATELEKSLAQVESAYKNYILVLAASSATGTDDAVYTYVKGNMSKDLAGLIAAIQSPTEAGITIPSEVNTLLTSAAITKLAATKVELNDALRALNTMITENKASYSWSEISAAMNPLVDTNDMRIGSSNYDSAYTVNEAQSKVGELASLGVSGKLNVHMPSESGIYADIADHIGTYLANTTVSVNYSDIVVDNVNVTINVSSSLNYLDAFGTAAEKGSPAGDGAAQPLTDLYGYVIDLAFRTNATQSDLMLQIDPADRIYEENGVNNEETLGNGSSMTFTSADITTFKMGQMKELMKAIRVVFFTPGTTSNTILATAKLDMTEGNTVDEGGNTVTAKLYLYTVTSAAGYAAADGTEATGTQLYTKTEAYTSFTGTPASGTSYYYQDGDSYVLAEGDKLTDNTPLFTKTETYTPFNETKVEGTTYYVKVEAGETRLDKDASVITALPQNTATPVSVLVYLDGNEVENKDVAAVGSTSMTGTMNLQFASSATLVPMSYAGLQAQGGTAGGDTPDATPTVNVTKGEGVEGPATATVGQPYTFTVAATHTLSKVIIGTEELTLTASDNSYTIPADKIVEGKEIQINTTPVT